VLTCLVRKI